METIISFNNVGKIYSGGSIGLKEASFTVSPEEFFVLVGPSGCGKSTVLRIIAGLEKATSGIVTAPADVAMVFQSGALFPWLSVFDNIALGLRAKNVDEKKVEEQCKKIIELVGLTEFTQKFPRDLSGGQRQRVGIARALAVEPKVLLLDEPFSALDTVTTDELHRDLIKIWQTTKKTIVMVSHSIEEAVTLADRIMYMKAGSIVQIYQIKLPYPRREKEAEFMHDVQNIRKKFFE